ncbi:unnamed protein product, partial [marine sediment metagenome]
MVYRPLRHLIVGVLALALVAHATGTLCARTGAPLTRITDIKITGLKRVPLEKVMQAIRLRQGDLFSFAAVDDDVRRLDALGLFYPTGIRVRREPYRDGVRLVFGLEERPLISHVKFVGNRAFSDKKLRQTVGLKD